MKKVLVEKMLTAAIVVVAFGVLSGCISSRAYVDPQYRKASLDSIRRLPAPVLVRLDARYQQNGQAFPAGDAELRWHVDQMLRATGVFEPTIDAGVPATISVTANNIVDLAAARSAGIGAGLTFGVSGSMVEDKYEFTFIFRDGANWHTQSVFPHAIRTAIGSIDGPPGVKPENSPADAFGRVVDDAVLNFVKELQDKGMVSR